MEKRNLPLSSNFMLKTDLNPTSIIYSHRVLSPSASGVATAVSF
jgi:hypothetical protein